MASNKKKSIKNTGKKRPFDLKDYVLRNLPVLGGIAVAVIAVVVILCITLGGRSKSGDEADGNLVQVETEALDGSSKTTEGSLTPDLAGGADGSGEATGYSENDFVLTGKDTDGIIVNGSNGSTGGNSSGGNTSTESVEGRELAIIGLDGEIIDLSEYTDDSKTDNSSSSSSSTGNTGNTGSSSSDSGSGSSDSGSGSSDSGSGSSGAEPTAAPYYDASEGKVYETERIPIN